MRPLNVPVRQLGKDGAQVSALGFGAVGVLPWVGPAQSVSNAGRLSKPVEVLSGFYGTPTADAERFAVLDRAHELGCTLWDTADGYGDSEELIGEWFRRTDKRKEIFLATKFGIQAQPDGSITVNNSPQYAKTACKKSLGRLGVESIDLYYCHRLNRRVPVEQVVKEMSELVTEGKVRYLGLSEVSSDTLRRACKVHHIAAVQIEYSPFTLDIESPQTSLLQTCRELGVAVIAYSPLGRGILTNRSKPPEDFESNDWRKMAPRFAEENFNANLQLKDCLMHVANAKKCPLSALVLAWLMAKGEDIIPIPGTKQLQFLEENMQALQISLSQDEIDTIGSHCARLQTMGDRYPELMTKDLFADTPPVESHQGINTESATSLSSSTA